MGAQNIHGPWMGRAKPPNSNVTPGTFAVAPARRGTEPLEPLSPPVAASAAEARNQRFRRTEFGGNDIPGTRSTYLVLKTMTYGCVKSMLTCAGQS